MLSKLLKYDLKSMMKTWVILAIVSFVISIILGIYISDISFESILSEESADGFTVFKTVLKCLRHSTANST